MALLSLEIDDKYSLFVQFELTNRGSCWMEQHSMTYHQGAIRGYLFIGRLWKNLRLNMGTNQVACAPVEILRMRKYLGGGGGKIPTTVAEAGLRGQE